MRAVSLFLSIVVCGSHALSLPSAVASHSSSRLSTPLARLSADSEIRIHAEADAFFDTIDVDGDGIITFEELEQQLQERGYQPGGIEHIFDLLDINRDGAISQAELRTSFVKFDDPGLRTALGLGESEADAIFSSIDANGDNEISRDELRQYLTANGYSAATADSLFDTLDDNSDGAVSRDELHEGYESYSALRDIIGLPAYVVDF